MTGMLFPWFRSFALMVGLATSFSLTTALPGEPLDPNAPHQTESDQNNPGDPFWTQDRLLVAAQVDQASDLQTFAQQVAATPFVPKLAPPPALAALSYEQFIQIRPQHGHAIWDRTGTPFLLETFHQGGVQRDRVTLFTRADGWNQLYRFKPYQFDYGTTQLSESDLRGADHAGIKVVGRFPGQDDFQEMLTFLGSSYFRARSGDTFYGTSARGLAVDIGLPQDEEFPFFRAFWVGRPADDATDLEILALLDSPSCTGAYRFRMVPGGDATEIDVEATLFFRRPIEKLALGPLTSMWMWGDGLTGPSLDERSQVHDSQGLQIIAGDGEAIWRPFSRIEYPSVSRFEVASVHEFGVWQRDRDFANYRDSNARYDRRPSVWVRPAQSWDGGAIEVLEIPGAHEGIDNIGVYWIPPETVQAGGRRDFAYRVGFTSKTHPESVRERLATVDSFALVRRETEIELTADFTGPALADADLDGIEIAVATVRGEVDAPTRTPIEGGVRLKWVMRPTEAAPMGIRATLRRDGTPISETLAYLCPHERPTFVFPKVYTKTE